MLECQVKSNNGANYLKSRLFFNELVSNIINYMKEHLQNADCYRTGFCTQLSSLFTLASESQLNIHISLLAALLCYAMCLPRRHFHILNLKSFKFMREITNYNLLCSCSLSLSSSQMECRDFLLFLEWAHAHSFSTHTSVPFSYSLQAEGKAQHLRITSCYH